MNWVRMLHEIELFVQFLFMFLSTFLFYLFTSLQLDTFT